MVVKARTHEFSTEQYESACVGLTQYLGGVSGAGLAQASFAQHGNILLTENQFARKKAISEVVIVEGARKCISQVICAYFVNHQYFAIGGLS